MNTHITHPDTDLTQWIGRTETLTGGVTAQAAAMIHATLGAPDRSAPASGAPMPALWHWYGFAPTAHMDELGPDGHPCLGGFLPPVPLERRMWASGALSFHTPLHVGEALTRRSTIANVAEKEGTAGRMVFVSVDHEISGARGLAVSERQEIVYLAIPPTFTPPPAKQAPTEALVLDRQAEITAPHLFRYSAITFNAHRIHYDVAYTREVEHYPDLVVHGPLQAQLLADAAQSLRAEPLSAFRFRGIHPMFGPATLGLRATTKDQNTTELCTVAPEGHIGMQATASWEG